MAYSGKVAKQILERVMLSQGIAEIGRDPNMPDKATIFRWLADNDDFCDRYTRAKAVCADHMEEEILDIADNSANDYMERQNADGTTYEVVNSEHINRSRLRIESRKWLMSKLKPKKYGDRVNLDHGAQSSFSDMMAEIFADKE